MTVSERFRRALLALYLLLLLIVAQGCASQATFQFACEPGNEINGGLLLTIDVVVIDDSEERQIRQLGDEVKSALVRYKEAEVRLLEQMFE